MRQLGKHAVGRQRSGGSAMLGRVPPRREEAARREHGEEPRRGEAVERAVVGHEEALRVLVHPGAAGRHPRGEGAVLDERPGQPRLLLLLGVVGGVHAGGEVGAHGVEALVDDVHGRGDERVADGAEPGELGEAAHGVRQRGDGVVADVELPERDEEADGVGELPEELEVLADVERLEVDEVLEAVGERAEAVEPGVQRPERRHVRRRVGELGQLVGVHRQLPEAVQLEPQRVRQLRQLVEVGVQLLQCTVHSFISL
uniref:Uncharacterized protein n=1 Tax=Oryza brachyantha TaxID=4533 RepID=J3M157_ORYBR